MYFSLKVWIDVMVRKFLCSKVVWILTSSKTELVPTTHNDNKTRFGLQSRACLHTHKTDRKQAFFHDILVSLMRSRLMYLNLSANYCQTEQLSDNYTKMEMTAFAQSSPTVKWITGTNPCPWSLDLVTLRRQSAAQSFWTDREDLFHSLNNQGISVEAT